MEPWLIPVALAAVAALYASVGHAGASGYLAVLALAGLAPAELRPTALTLNLLVATVATLRFGGAGHFRWRILWPFLATAFPMAFVGGSLPVDPTLYRILLGAVLLFAAWRLIAGTRKSSGENAGAELPAPTPPLLAALLIGALIGLASGVVGVGGGIFLSPILLLAGWATPKEAAGVAAPFILANSASGLTGQLLQGAVLPEGLPLWLGAVFLGGWVGATFGSRRATGTGLRRLLALVLVLAGAKLLLPV